MYVYLIDRIILFILPVECKDETYFNGEFDLPNNPVICPSVCGSKFMLKSLQLQIIQEGIPTLDCLNTISYDISSFCLVHMLDSILTVLHNVCYSDSLFWLCCLSCIGIQNFGWGWRKMPHTLIRSMMIIIEKMVIIEY